MILSLRLLYTATLQRRWTIDKLALPLLLIPYRYGPGSFVIHNDFNFNMRLLAALDTLIGSTPDDRATQRWDRDPPNVEARLNGRRVE